MFSKGKRVPRVPDNDDIDLFVVGGGINGTGIARDAAGRGLSVVLCEQGDLASATSSASTKLIHGGLRYLEYYEFRLVRESLSERETLLKLAPHIIRPLRFVLAHDKHQRPAWLIRLGLFLYDHLGGREVLPGCQGISFADHPTGHDLVPGFTKGFVYSDCWVDDARLVVLNAMSAREQGAEILTRTRCSGARREDGRWLVTLSPRDGGPERTLRAKVLINAAGPWAGDFLSETLDDASPHPLRLVKGSHIVVPRLFDHDYAYIFQNPDGRIVFAIPYEADFTLIGTTDVDFSGDPSEARASDGEIAYLCEAVNRYFQTPTTPESVVWSFSGVRPLFGDPQKDPASLTRDYVLDVNTGGDGAAPPLLSVFGGKITTYRKLAEQVLSRLEPWLGSGKEAWTQRAPLPGGNMIGVGADQFLEEARVRYPWLDDKLLTRYVRAYGGRIRVLLTGAYAYEHLGVHFGGGLYEAEVRYLSDHEWAVSAEDILWRRSKLGLHVDAATVARLEAWLAEQTEPPAEAVPATRKTPPLARQA